MSNSPLGVPLLEDYENEISEIKEKQTDSQRAKYLTPYRSNFEQKKDEEVVEDRITAALEADIKEKYLEILNLEKRVLLAKKLEGVGRWAKDGVKQKVDPDFIENDLDHVEELIKWANEIRRDYPNLWKAVTGGDERNWVIFFKMLIPHDNGEIIVKDMPRAHDDFNGKKGIMHKRKERWSAVRLFDLYLPPEQAKEFKQLHQRWDRRLPEDWLVNLGHILDKGQASQNVAKHVVPFNRENPFFKGTLEGIDAPMIYLERMGGLPKEARKELLAFAEEKIFKNWLLLEDDWIVAIVDDARRKFRKLMEA